MSVFRRCDVEIPQTLREVNIIGVDFDDEDLCASIVVEVKPYHYRIIRLKSDLNKWNIKNILNIDSATNKVDSIGFKGEFDGIFCASNFLCYPGSIKSKSQVAKNHGILLTNSECMQYAFNLFINKLFENKNERIDKEKRSILLVSRPAERVWESKEKEYAALLKEKLKIKDYSQPVDIVIVSESQAVCALAVRNGGPVSPAENAVIIKCGSSSFDMAVVRQGNIPANWEYSRQFGTGKIENLMFQQFMDKQPGKKPVTPIARSKLFLRELKERFYGSDDEPGDKGQVFTIAFEDQPKPVKVYKDINDQFMEQTLNKTGPVTIEASMEGIDQEEYASWHEACLAVFRRAKQQMEKCLKGEKLHKMVLTGVGSVMPEVQQIAQKCFVGTELVCRRYSPLSVVKGLKLEDAFNDIFSP